MPYDYYVARAFVALKNDVSSVNSKIASEPRLRPVWPKRLPYPVTIHWPRLRHTSNKPTLVNMYGR